MQLVNHAAMSRPSKYERIAEPSPVTTIVSPAAAWRTKFPIAK
jgi:hypothetical protein